MKKFAITFCTAAFLFACNSEEKKAEAAPGDTKVASSTSESQAKSDEWVPVDSAAAMKAWQADMTPGEPHAMMAKWDGTWNAETTMWMSADAPAEKSTGTSVNKMVLGGRFQKTSFKGTMGGYPFEGEGTLAYDNGRKMYVSTWMDNMSTGQMHTEGTWDPATKSLTMTGKMFCSANGKDCNIREVFKIIDDNTQMMEMYGPDMKTGKEYKNMEIKYTRKK